MSGNDTRVIPEDVLPFVRTGAHVLIGDVADALAEANDAQDREDRANGYEALDRVRALLAVLGRASELRAVTLDLASHGGALRETTDTMLRTAINALEESRPADRARLGARVRVLRDFGKDLDHTLPSRNNRHMRPFYATADALLAELDAERADP